MNILLLICVLFPILGNAKEENWYLTEEYQKKCDDYIKYVAPLNQAIFSIIKESQDQERYREIAYIINNLFTTRTMLVNQLQLAEVDSRFPIKDQ